MYFFMFNGKTLSTTLNNKLSKKKIMLILLISIFLILNKKTLYFDQKKCYINIVK